MADTAGAPGTHSTIPSSDNPHQLNTNIESGTFDEKAQHHDAAEPPVKKSEADEEEDEDMDALIDELESQDGHAEEEEAEEDTTPGGGRVVPEGELQTDTRIGLTDAEVTLRRKKYGMNQMKEEKENLILKFLGYFIGPIQFVMEVSHRHFSSSLPKTLLCGAPMCCACSACFFHSPTRTSCLICKAPKCEELLRMLRANHNVYDRLPPF
jgi:hypothetical protein